MARDFQVSKVIWQYFRKCFALRINAAKLDVLLLSLTLLAATFTSTSAAAQQTCPAPFQNDFCTEAIISDWAYYYDNNIQFKTVDELIAFAFPPTIGSCKLDNTILIPFQYPPQGIISRGPKAIWIGGKFVSVNVWETATISYRCPEGYVFPGYNPSVILLRTRRLSCPDGFALSGLIVDQYLFCWTKELQTFTITLSGGTTSEPWHKKHDPDHLKANLPYKAIVKDQNDKPKTDFAVTITTDVTSNSGGHIHTTGRPKGKLVDQVGASVKTKDGKVEIKGKTDGNGVFEFTFGAEEASGTHTLTAKCDSGCQAPATATIDVGIKNLMRLDSDPLGYTLTGEKAPHPDNHYFSSAALVKIINLAHRYKKEFNKQKYKNPPYTGIFKTPLVINDSSLEKGGTFDVLQDWTSLSNVHGGHRQGVVVDINGIKEESIDFEELAEFCCQITADWHPGGTGAHYHLKLLGRDQ